MTDDLLVIGGGAVGLATAIAARDRGFTVTLIDRGVVGKEASWAGAGILFPLLPWKYADDVNDLALEGIRAYPEFCRRLYDETGTDPELLKHGMVIVDPEDTQQALDWCAAHALAAELIPTPLAWLASRPSLHLPDVLQVRNPRLLASMRQLAEKLGVRIVEGCGLRRFHTQGSLVISAETTDSRSIRARRFVLCGGAWSGELLKQWAPAAAVRPVRGQMLLFKFPSPPFLPVLFRGGYYLVPRRDGHLLVGSTLEEVGFDKSTTPQALELILSATEVLVPGIRRQPLIRQWAGLRPGSPENRPTIGRHPDIENLYINAGHFRYGVTMAPAAAARLVDILGATG